jgi:hypothetical protein
MIRQFFAFLQTLSMQKSNMLRDDKKTELDCGNF